MQAFNCAFYFQGHIADVPSYPVDSPDNGPGFSDQILARAGTQQVFWFDCWKLTVKKLTGTFIGAMNANKPTQFILSNGTDQDVNTFDTSPFQMFTPFQWKPFNEPVPR